MFLDKRMEARMVPYNCYSSPSGSHPKKGKVGKMKGFKRESCSAEKCKVLQNHEKVGALVMGKNANSPD